MEGAPDPSLGHDGSAGDARCVLDHLPDPCDYADKKGKKCTEYGDPNDLDYVPPKSWGAYRKHMTRLLIQRIKQSRTYHKEMTRWRPTLPMYREVLTSWLVTWRS